MKMKFNRKNNDDVNALLKRRDIIDKYITKFFTIYYNSFDIPELNEEQLDFIKREFWANGKVLAFVLQDSQMPDYSSIYAVQKDEERTLVFTPFAPTFFNIYNYPTQVRPIRLKGATFIPDEIMYNMHNCVVGWAHSSRKSIKQILQPYIDQLVEIDVTINNNLFAHRLPRLVIVSPEDEERVRQIMKQIEVGENVIFLSASDWQAIKNVLESGQSYIIDKLYKYRIDIESEALTMLGMNNVHFEKQERLLTDEVNANNQLIDTCGDSIIMPVKRFCEYIGKYLGVQLTVDYSDHEKYVEAKKTDESEDSENEN